MRPFTEFIVSILSLIGIEMLNDESWFLFDEEMKFKRDVITYY